MKIKKLVLISLISVLVLSLLLVGQAQPALKKVNGYPSRPISLVIAYGVGGGADTFARTLAPFLTKRAKVPVNVVNVTGAGGENAVIHVMGQPADGYTLFLVALDHAQHEAYREVKYPILENFSLVCRLVQEYYGAWVTADSPFKSLDNLTTYAKKNPGEVKIAGHSAGGTTEISCHLFQYKTGTKLNYIPFGTAKSVSALLGGHGDVLFQKTGPMVSLVKAGKIRGLAVGGPARTLPDIPTFRELGYDMDLPIWRGIAVKKEASDEIVKYLQELFYEALQDPGYQALAEKYFYSLEYLKGKEFEEFFKSERENYGQLFKAIGWGEKK